MWARHTGEITVSRKNECRELTTEANYLCMTMRGASMGCLPALLYGLKEWAEEKSEREREERKNGK